MATNTRPLVVQMTLGTGHNRDFYYLHENGKFAGGYGARGFATRKEAIAFMAERGIVRDSRTAIVRSDGYSIRTDLTAFA